jgi:hypothetical protein
MSLDNNMKMPAPEESVTDLAHQLLKRLHCARDEMGSVASSVRPEPSCGRDQGPAMSQGGLMGLLREAMAVSEQLQERIDYTRRHLGQARTGAECQPFDRCIETTAPMPDSRQSGSYGPIGALSPQRR